MNGDARFQDDETIASTCDLLRRIHPDWIVTDANTGEPRISSQGFLDLSMSIHVGDDLRAQGYQYEDVLKDRPTLDLAAIKALTARSLEQAVYKDHDPKELCHGIVAGKKSRRVARELARNATENWIVRRPR